MELLVGGRTRLTLRQLQDIYRGNSERVRMKSQQEDS